MLTDCLGNPPSRGGGGGATTHSRTEHLWILTQLARWAEIPFPRNYVEILERICNISMFSTAPSMPSPRRSCSRSGTPRSARC